MVFHEITRDAIQRALERDARHRRAPRRRAGDAPHPRPALRLRGLARALEEGDAAALRGPRAVRRDAARRRARARAHALRRRVATGTSSARSSPGAFDGTARRRSRARGSRRAATSARTGRRHRTRSSCSTRRRARALADGLEGRPFTVEQGRREAVHAAPGGAVPHVDAAAGGEPQAPLLVADDDAPRAAALRERPHHVHAHRLGDAVRRRAEGGAGARRPRVRRRDRPAEPRRYERAVANAQEAHEAIRPAGRRVPDARRARAASSSRDELALYDLVFKRTVASQMKDASGQTVLDRARRDRGGRAARDVPARAAP